MIEKNFQVMFAFIHKMKFIVNWNKLAVAGCLIVLFGVFLGWAIVPLIVHYGVVKVSRLSVGSDMFKMWHTLPIPLEFRVRIFNVTNPDEVTAGALPQLQEVGPYIYDLHISRNVTEYGKDTFDYIKYNRYVFNEIKSGNLSENDIVTVLNPPLMAMALLMERISPFGIDILNKAASEMFPDNPLFLKANVGDLMFKGVTVPCSSERKNASFHRQGPEIDEEEEELDEDLSQVICAAIKTRSLQTIAVANDTESYSFSFFRHKNITGEGPYRMKAGIQNINQRARLIRYQGYSNLTMWTPNSSCNALLGTDSTMFSPFISEKSALWIFSPDICLSIKAIYDSEVNAKGLTLSHYIVDNNSFISDEGDKCKCYRDDYSDSNEKPECTSYSGVVDLTPCQGGPIYMSQPHFYGGSPELTNYSGLKPNKEQHASYLLMDRLTGTPVVGWKRLQLNLELKQIEDLDLVANVTEGIFPIVWVEEGAELDGSILRPLYQVYLILYITMIVRWTLIILGLTMLTVSLMAKYLPKDDDESSENQAVFFSRVSVPNKIRRLQEPSVTVS